jgi:3-deoxy-7-phosphoheptulonate synthase
LDLNAIALVKQLSHLPVISDPSHGTGLWELVEPMSLASIAVGADGLMIEVHPNPEVALSDGPQSLKPDNFDKLMKVASNLANMIGKPMAKKPH